MADKANKKGIVGGFKKFLGNNNDADSDMNGNELEEEMAREEEMAAEGDSEAGDSDKEFADNQEDVSNNAEDSADEGRNKELEEKLAQAEKEVAKSKDDYLRLVAEFDNFRRREAKNRLELIESAGEKVLKELLPIIDDFERALVALEGSDDSQSAQEGTNLIYKKLKDFLKSQNVSEIEAIGKELDTDVHEAIAQIPAPDPKQKGKIIDVTQKGYKLGEKVIRFAKVVVGV